MTVAGTPARDISRGEFVTLIAGFTAINAAAIDVMLPALPYMGDALGVENPNDRSLVLTVFLVGLGLPQLILGPVTDRFGRRIPLLIGLAIYTAAALAAVLAPSFGVLLALRFLQGVGSAAVAVASQAAVRDRYAGNEMAEVMSVVFSIFMIIPVVAPSVGQVILLTGPWQLIFLFMAAIGGILGVWAFIRLAETLPEARRRPLSFASVAEGFGIVLRTRRSLFYGLAGMLMFAGVLGFVNTSQQIYVDLYGVGALFPVAFSILPISFAVAFFINARLVKRYGMRRMAHAAILAFVGITGVWLILALVIPIPLWLFGLMLALTALAQGIAWGNVGALAMEPLGAVAGTASAVFGSLSTVGAALLAYVVAQAFDGTTTPVIAAFFVVGLLVTGCFLIAENGRLFGNPDPAGGAVNPPPH